MKTADILILLLKKSNGVAGLFVVDVKSGKVVQLAVDIQHTSLGKVNLAGLPSYYKSNEIKS